MVEMHVLLIDCVSVTVRQLTGSQSFLDVFTQRGLNMEVV